ncbi:hypothetical protein AMJ44_14760 [candidate division WOR-1 bacterium DG_54_3]|uniref:Uncharacterized protein n=1 Tax=candidate division WOR-1 bacterium DG_54_3 TaxID=1703775 RepID=A0A0S7XKS3_UNCSA|nr:MAG: hypothetical protein AMJ44_14760 [candidate division WOR-1 bacterium DG_54_3]
MRQQENKQYFKFLDELNTAKANSKNIHGEAIIINDEEVEKRIKEGKNLIDIEKIEIDEKLVGELFQILCPILKKYEAFFSRSYVPF